MSINEKKMDKICRVFGRGGAVNSEMTEDSLLGILRGGTTPRNGSKAGGKADLTEETLRLP